MHEEIIAEEQRKLLPLLKEFSKEYYLVGGTAVGLYIGHRYSIDFDMFTSKKVKPNSIRHTINKFGFTIGKTLYSDFEQIHLLVENVKLTFFTYPFKIKADKWFRDIIQIPSLLDLAAMKAFALGGRGKWKDYVDLYFIFKNHFSVNEVSARAIEIFGDNHFNDRLFREQLCYFKDIDYQEEVIFLENEVDENQIKNYLTKVATQEL